MNPEWNHDDASLDALIRTATEEVQPSTTFLARLERELVQRPDASSHASVVLKLRRSLLAAAAVVAMLFTGWQLQEFDGQIRVQNVDVPKHTQDVSTEATPIAVLVSFKNEQDAIVLREPTTDPNVTILWIHPVTTTHAAAPATIEVDQTPEKGSDS